ncbi:MAG: flagellar hook-length control protein FliK, partial [Desulfofundulus sp.]
GGKTFETLLEAGDNRGQSMPTIAAATLAGQLQEAAGFLPVQTIDAAGQAGQNTKTLKPALPGLQQDGIGISPGDNGRGQKVILQSSRLLALQVPDAGAANGGAPNVQQLESYLLKFPLSQLIQQNGREVIPQKVGSREERLLNGYSVPEGKVAGVPPGMNLQSKTPGDVLDFSDAGNPNTRSGVAPRPIVQDATSPVVPRNNSAGSPSRNPAQYQSTSPAGEGIIGISNNSAHTVVHPENLNPVQMPALIVRVLREAVARNVEGQTHLWFKLEPEHLGEVMVRLVYRHGDVSAHFLASNAAAGDALESALPQLRENLAAQNLHLQSASVSVGHDGGTSPRSDYQQPGYNSGRPHGGSGEGAGGSAGYEPAADPLPDVINFFV